MLSKIIHHLVWIVIGCGLFITSCTGQQQGADDSAVEKETVDSPSVNLPPVNSPTIAVPDTTPPTVAVPTVNIPTVDVPEVKLPEITVPEVLVRQNDKLTVYTLPADILFDFDQSNIRPDAEIGLQQISGSIAKRFPSVPLQIRGHTDSKGEEDYNLALSERRSASVKQWLITNASISASLMSTQGYGESQPVAPNANIDGADNPSGRQLNRRVEIVVLTP